MLIIEYKSKMGFRKVFTCSKKCAVTLHSATEGKSMNMACKPSSCSLQSVSIHQ